MRILSGIFLAVLTFSAWAKGDAEAIYPSNPNLVGDAVIVSGSGVTRIELNGLTPSWHSLDGVEPFEPVVAGGLVLVGSASGLFALKIDSGEIAWHLPSDHAMFTPTVMEGVAYVGGEDGTLRAVDLRSGKEKWHHRFSGWIFSPAVVANHLVTGGSEGKLWGITASDGSERWQKALGEELIYRPVAGNDDPVYVSTSGGSVVAVGADKGDLRWQTRLDTPTTATVYGSRIFFVQFSGLVTAHDRYNGRKLWEFQLQGPSTVPARVLDGKILAITDEGASVMLEPENGKVVEESPPQDSPHGPDTNPETAPQGDQLMTGLP